MEINKIYNEECIEGMKRIPDSSVDMILCDLPYGTTACAWDTIIPLEEMWEQYYRVLRPNGFIVLTASNPFTSKLVSSNMDNFSHQWVWEKHGGGNPLLANVMPMKNFEDIVVFTKEYKNYDYDGVHPIRPYASRLFEYIGKTKKQIFEDMGNQTVCHFMRFNSTQFSFCTEEVYNFLIDEYQINEWPEFKTYEELSAINQEFKDSTESPYPRVYNPQMTKGELYVNKGMSNIKHLKSGVKEATGKVSDERYPKAIIKFPYDKERGFHPTQKPVALFEYLIKTYTNEGDTVLDNCMGSGTTALACIRTNRNYIGFELDESYHSIALQRIEEEHGKD